MSSVYDPPYPIPYNPIAGTTRANAGTPPVYNVLDYGADPTGAADSLPAILQARVVCKANGGGQLYYPPGEFKISGSIPLSSGIYHIGAGEGATLLTATANLVGMFSAILLSGQSLTECGVGEMTIDGLTGVTGTTTGVELDSSASAAILTRGVWFDRLHFMNCLAGINHAGNNANAGAMNNKVTAQSCVFDACGAGYELLGTYGVEIVNCHGLQNTVATVLSPTIKSGGAVNAGTGPTTVTRISGLHSEGRGDLTGTLGYTDDAIAFGGSDTRIIDCELSNISEFPIHFESAEGEGSFIGHIMVWGCGGPMLYCDSSTLSEPAIVSDYVGAYICRNTSLNPNYGQRAAVAFNGGTWMADNIMVADAASNPVPYALSVGADAPNQTGIIRVSRFFCPAPSTEWLQVLNTQSDMDLRISDSPGYNPTGPQTAPAIPASGTALTNPFPFDCTVYVNGGTVTAVAISGTDTGQITGAFSLPAGETITLTYSVVPTSWTWFGN